MDLLHRKRKLVPIRDPPMENDPRNINIVSYERFRGISKKIPICSHLLETHSASNPRNRDHSMNAPDT